MVFIPSYYLLRGKKKKFHGTKFYRTARCAARKLSKFGSEDILQPPYCTNFGVIQ